MVGGPFSGKTPEEKEQNIVATERLGIEVAEAGGAPIVPNSMGRTWSGSPGYEVWMEITLSILARCQAFIVTPDWDRSSGTRREVEASLFLGVPVFYDIVALRSSLAIKDELLRVASPVEKRRLQTVQAGVEICTKPRGGFVEQLHVVNDAIRALQSLDSLAFLASDADYRMAGYEQLLFERHALLTMAG
jgi:hypothetical protein